MVHPLEILANPGTGQQYPILCTPRVYHVPLGQSTALSCTHLVCITFCLLSSADANLAAQISKSLLSDLVDRYLETELLGYMVTLCLPAPQ